MCQIFCVCVSVIDHRLPNFQIVLAESVEIFIQGELYDIHDFCMFSDFVILESHN